MPPRRNKAGASMSSRAAQSTLSFNNRAGRVTKPSTSQPASDKKPSSKLHQVAQAEIIEQISEPEPAVATIEIKHAKSPEQLKTQEPQEETETTPTKPLQPKRKLRTSTSSLTSSDLDTALTSAKSVPETKIKKYWKAEESSRLAPRVHQSTLPLQEKILRHFDLSSQYGPCIGIPRLSRWKRAYTLNLNPPIEVLAVLLKEETKGDKRDTGTIAYVDELGAGRVGILE